MTAGDAMRGLFKAIGDYVRSTQAAETGRPAILHLDNGTRPIAGDKAIPPRGGSGVPPMPMAGIPMAGGFILVDGRLDHVRARTIKRAHERGEPLPHGARYVPNAETMADAMFRRHADGTGFTIDGSTRPGDPTRPGEQNTGAFLGLQSGHALACLKAWADKAGMEFDESLGFEGNLTQWFIDQGNFREGR